MKDLLVVSHCILNKASKVAQDESELAEEYRQRDALIRLAIDRDVQLIQLPCPEFIIYGAARWGHVKDQFDNPYFREQSRAMLKPVIMQLKEYAQHPESFNIIGIVSVEGSPSCGSNLTCRAEWGGELTAELCADGGPSEKVRMVNEAGVYMEELASMLTEHELNIPVYSIPEAVSLINKQFISKEKL